MATRKDPYVNFNFLVEIDGITRAAFHEAGGLDSSIDTIEHREGGENITMRKLPGQVKFSNISLKWGMSDDTDLYAWHKQWADGDPAASRRNGSIVLLDRQGQEKARWNFFNAWPAKWTGPSFNAEANDIAIESLELAHEGLARA
ncbi:phage tail protein [Ramlibacter sp.]|uniref:phage tail protein n=1 Tax=Ramlibacter sp. TaxID=1917967 RepID=UPI00180C98F7|nr:phage tail protein [Ramlibacter sp.]MBA2676260.1 phage tail protein [Ramlibacter sp.]